MSTISYSLDVETSKGYKKIIDLHNQATSLFAKGVTLRLNNDFSRPLGKITGDVKQFDASLDAATARVVAFTSTTTILYAVGSAMKRLASDAIGVQDALAKIQSISSSSGASMKNLGESLFKVANATGNSFYDVAKAAEEFSRQGLSTAESLKAVTAAANLARLSGTELKDSIGGLVSIISTFSSQALEYSDVVNKLASVDAQFATSAAGLVSGLSRVAGVAEQSGISLEKTISLIASVKQLTGRSEAVISNGLKTILTNLKTEGVQESLRAIGVEVKDAKGNFRDLVDVLKDYQRVSETLDPQRKANTELKIAGKYQVNTLSGITRALDEKSGKESVFSKAEKAANPDADVTKKRIDLLNSTTKTREQILQNNITKLGANLGDQIIKPTVDKSIAFFDGLITKIDKVSSSVSYIFKGIGDVIAGPVLQTAAIALIGLFIKLAKEIGGVVKSVLDFGNAGKKNVELQNTINLAFQNGNKFLVEQVRNATTLEQRQIALNKLLADYLNMTRSAQKFQFLDVGLVSAGNSKRIRNKASGHMPDGYEAAFAREQYQIESGVGGASRNAKPLLKSLNLSGVTEPVVVNSDEVIVRNFLGTGRDSVLNKNMISRIGKSKISQLGSIENLAIGKTPLPASNIGFYGPDIKREDARRLFQTIQSAREKISAKDRSLSYSEEIGIKRALSSFKYGIGRGDAYTATAPGVTPSSSYFRKDYNRAELVALNNRIQAEIQLTKAVRTAREDKAEELRSNKKNALERKLIEKTSIDAAAGRITSVESLRKIISDEAGGKAKRVGYLTDTVGEKYINKAFLNEADKLSRTLGNLSKTAENSGKVLGGARIEETFKSYNFSGSAAEKEKFLRPIVDQFKEASKLTVDRTREEYRKNAPARAELTLNKEIEAARANGTKSFLGLRYGQMSEQDIIKRSDQLSSKFKLNPKQNVEFNVYRDQVLKDRAAQVASTNQSRLFGASFAIPLITGTISKGLEEKFTDLSGNVQKRETRASRFTSDIGGAISTGLTTNFFLSQMGPLVKRLAGPAAIAIGAYQVAGAVKNSVDSKTEFQKRDNAFENDKEKVKIETLSRYLELNSELKTTADYSKRKSLNFEIRQLEKSVSGEDLKKTKGFSSGQMSDFLIKQKEDSANNTSSRAFSDNISEIFTKRMQNSSFGQQVLNYSTDFFGISDAGKGGTGGKGTVFGSDRLTGIGGEMGRAIKDQLSGLASSIDYSKMSQKDYSRLTSNSPDGSTKLMGSLLDVVRNNKGLGISKSLDGLDKLSKNISLKDQGDFVKVFQDAIKRGFKDSKSNETSNQDKKTDDLISTFKSIIGEIKTSLIDIDKKSILSSVSSQEILNKNEILKSKGSISDYKFNSDDIVVKLIELNNDSAKNIELLKNEFKESISELILKNGTDEQKSTLLNSIKNEGVDSVIKFNRSGGVNTRYNSFDTLLSNPAAKDQFDSAVSKFNLGKQSISSSAAGRASQSLNEFKKIEELRKIDVDKRREDQILNFSGFTDPSQYNSLDSRINSSKSARENLAFSFKQTPDESINYSADRGNYFRKKYSLDLESVKNDPLLLQLPSDATQSQIDYQDIYKKTKRDDISASLSESYRDELKGKTLSSIGTVMSDLNSYQSKYRSDSFVFNPEQRASLADKIKVGDYAGARDLVGSQQKFLESSPDFSKERKETLSKYLGTAYTSLERADKSQDFISTRAEAEAKKIVPDKKEVGADTINEEISKLDNTIGKLTTYLEAQSGSSSSSDSNVALNIKIEGLMSSPEFSEKIKSLISEETLRLINANIDKPAVVPPPVKK